ncbi:505f3e0a-8005-46ca-be49-b987d1fac54f [Thermothielavioides terrestris]|uniref:505f3e0a-8005-46ca-be49-b987d1fac54f n=1 Tax=Thermothielavioides terrestris TaxID=2587410 RepID=A0A3S4ATA6_9PEZI|nr:505f3e0a-8005-46ca-be49-b987d1fac54f [Thermothielavioides terrestris]
MGRLNSLMAPRGADVVHAQNPQLANYYYSCTEVTPTCPVQATTLGYYPNRGINIFFAVGFAVAMVVTLILGVKTKTWSYMAFIAAGTALELAGYLARVPLTDNPWNKDAFETQIVAIILAPTLVCISIYLTLKHVCLSLNPALSRIRPHLYPFIFVPLDVSCLCVQAIGGSLAASAALSNFQLVQSGNRCIIAGIVLQVVVLLFFGSSATDYFFRVKKWIKSDEANPEAVALWHDKKFRMFAIAEMAGGWGNPIMQDEPSFIVLEGFMVLIPCLLLASFSPGILFPQMSARMSARSKPQDSKGNDVEKPPQPESTRSQPQASGDESGPNQAPDTTEANPVSKSGTIEPNGRGDA